MARYKLDIGGRILDITPGRHDVGRMDGCWLILKSDRVSRYHARFHVRGGTLSVEDLGSRNGTFVNDERISGLVTLEPDDVVRIGDEKMKVLEAEATEDRISSDLRQTMGVGEDDPLARALLAELAEKSLRVGNYKDAERFATALAKQLEARRVPIDDPKARACIHCMIGLTAKLNSGAWVDRLFHLFASQRWIMSKETLTSVGEALDHVLRMPSTAGMLAYEKVLRELERDGEAVPSSLTSRVAEWADAYGAG